MNIPKGAQSLSIAAVIPALGPASQPVAVNIAGMARFEPPDNATAEDTRVSIFIQQMDHALTPWPKLTNKLASAAITLRMGRLVLPTILQSYVLANNLTIEQIRLNYSLLEKAYGYMDIEVPVFDPNNVTKTSIVVNRDNNITVRRRLLQAVAPIQQAPLFPPSNEMYKNFWWNASAVWNTSASMGWTKNILIWQAYNSSRRVVSANVSLLFLLRETERYNALIGSTGSNNPFEHKFAAFLVSLPQSPEAPSLPDWAIPTISVVSGAVVLVLLAMLWCCRKRTKKAETKPMLAEHGAELLFSKVQIPTKRMDTKNV